MNMKVQLYRKAMCFTMQRLFRDFLHVPFYVELQRAEYVISASTLAKLHNMQFTNQIDLRVVIYGMKTLL